MNLGTSASVTLWFDVEIRFYASFNAVELYVPALYKSSGSGLCGNFNEDPTDDLTGPDLKVYPNTEEGLSHFDCSWTWSQDQCSCGITEADCIPNNQVIEVNYQLLQLYLNRLFLGMRNYASRWYVLANRRLVGILPCLCRSSTLLRSMYQ